MRQSFLFNTLFALGVNFIIKPIWVFGIDRSVQNQLGSEEYGLYFAIFNFTYLFQILLDFGLQNYNQTEIGSDNSKFGKLFPGMLSAKLLLTCSYLAVSILAGFLLGYASESFFPWLIFNQVLLSFNIFLRSNISAHRLFIKDAFLSVLDKSLMIIGGACMLIPAVKWILLSINHFVWIQTVSLLITSLFCVYYNLKLSQSFEWKFDTALFKKIIVQAVPFALIYFLMTIYYRVDSVMIEKLLGAEGAGQAGIYAQSYRIMESVNNIGYIVAGILLPLFAFQIGQNLSIHKVLKQGYNIMITIIVPIVLAGVFYSEEIISALYPYEDYTYSSRVFTILVLNFVPVGILYVLGPLLTAKKVFSVMIPSLIIACVLNIVTNYLLIPKYGALGAAVTTFGTQIFMLIVYWIAVLLKFDVKTDLKTVRTSALYIAAVLVITHFIHQSSLHWLLGIMIVGTVSLLISLLLKIIGRETLSLKIQ